MNPYREFDTLREQSVKANEDVTGIHTLQGHEPSSFNSVPVWKSYEVSHSRSAALMERGWGEARRRGALLLERLCDFLTLGNQT